MNSITNQLYNYFRNFHDFTVNEWKKLSQNEKIKTLSLVIFSLFIGFACIYKLHKFYQSKKLNPNELKIQKAALDIIDMTKQKEVEPQPKIEIERLTPESLSDSFKNESQPQESEAQKQIIPAEQPMKIEEPPKKDSIHEAILFKTELLNNLIKALTDLGGVEDIKQAEALTALKNKENNCDITPWNVLAIFHLLPRWNRDTKWDDPQLSKLLNIKEFILFSLMLDRTPFKLFGAECFKNASPEIRRNKQFVLEAMKLNLFIFSYLDEDLQNDDDVVSAYLHASFDRQGLHGAVLKDDKSFLLRVLTKTKLPKSFLCNASFITEPLRNDYEFTLTVLKENPHICDVDSALLNNKAWVLEAFTILGKKSPTIYKKLPINLVNDPAIHSAYIKTGFDFNDILCYSLQVKDPNLVLQLVKMNGLYLYGADKNLLDNYGIVLAAVTQNGKVLETVSERLKKNRTIALTAIKSHPLALRYVPAELKEELKDESVFKEAQNISRNKERLIEYIKEDHENFFEVAEELKKDPDMLLAYIGQNVNRISSVPCLLLKDKKFITQLSKNAPSDTILNLSSEQLTDPEVLLNLIENKYLVSINEMKDNKDFVMKAINLNPRYYIHLLDLKKDPEVALAALKLDRSLVSELNPELYHNKVFLLEAIKLNKFCYHYMNDDLQKDPDLIAAYQSQNS